MFKLSICSLLDKVPRPVNGEGTFSVLESSCHLLLPVWPLKDRGNSVNTIIFKLSV